MKNISPISANAKGLSPTGSLEKYQIQQLFESGRINKASYLQIAIEFDYPNQKLNFEGDEAQLFADRWSLEKKAHQVSNADVWEAITKYLKKECDENQTPPPQLNLFDSPLPIIEGIENAI